MDAELGADEPDRIEAQWRSLHPEYDYESTSLWVRMRRTTRMLTDAMAECTARFDITVADFDMMAALYRQGPPQMLSVNALARATTRTHGSISVHVDRLSRRGLVRRLNSREDARVSRVCLTQQGVALVRRMVPELVELQQDIFSALSSDERKMLDRALKTVWRRNASIKRTNQNASLKQL